MRLALLYALFALLATLANILTQDVWLRLWPSHHPIVTSMAAGTVAGLAVKYWLDKRYIFRFRPVDIAHDGRIFILYALMGVLTTAVFWGIEAAFHVAFGSREMRYLGAVLGLAIGYSLKYFLDRRFVFQHGRHLA